MFPKRSRHRAAFSSAISRYLEDGTLAKLREKWMPHRRGDCSHGGEAGASFLGDIDVCKLQAKSHPLKQVRQQHCAGLNVLYKRDFAEEFLIVLKVAGGEEFLSLESYGNA